jgi:16S rRNA processing protein RimM
MRGESRIEIGGVARAHGIRGEVVIVTHDPDSDTLGNIDKIYVGGVEKKILQARDTQRGWLVALEGVPTRNDAEALKGKPVEVDRDALELEPQDVLLDDLIDCEVRLPDGTPWGKVAEIMIGAHQDLLVIHDGDIERLLPLVDQFVTNVDLEAGVVTVNPPDELPENKR